MANTVNLTKKALRDIITVEELTFVSQRVNETFEDIDAYYSKFNVSQVNDFHRAFEKYTELQALETVETETEQTADSKPAETADSKPKGRAKKELPADAPEVCKAHSSFANAIMIELFTKLNELGIEYKTDSKGRITTKYAVLRYRKNAILVQGKSKLIKAKPEIVWDIHAGWDIEACLDCTTVADAIKLITVETAEQTAETAEEA